MKYSMNIMVDSLRFTEPMVLSPVVACGRSRAGIIKIDRLHIQVICIHKTKRVKFCCQTLKSAMYSTSERAETKLIAFIELLILFVCKSMIEWSQALKRVSHSELRQTGNGGLATA